ncbi:Psy2p [Sporobolomyces koalae]|uniref:Psy2p n=1 Tax=Sporobolomyces koalae TaxID=500713 RepID=UPI003170083E
MPEDGSVAPASSMPTDAKAGAHDSTSSSSSSDAVALPQPITTPTPDSPSTTTTELPAVGPSTPERSPRRDEGEPATSTSSSPASASSSSPSSAASSSPAGHGSNHPPSRRVKVYKLKDDAWVDLGTGTCRGVLIQQNSPPGDMEELDKKRKKIDPEHEGAWIVVKREKPKQSPTVASPSKADAASPEADKPSTSSKSEDEDGLNDDDDDERDVILKTRVQPYPPGYSEEFDDEECLEGEDGQTLDVGGYQRQQDTLIVWTERPEGDGDEMEMALSFATSTGCAEMWEFIKAARRFTAEQAMLSPSPSPSLSSPRAFPMHANFASSAATQLPTPSLGSIPHLENALRALSRTAASRERVALQIVKSAFIEKLIAVHQEAEDLESLDDLHALCRVMQNILLLNDNSIFETVLKDEIILGVAGILEYDPDFPTMKASYKSHLSSPNAFISLVPIESASLLSKIHQTHRLHYLKDVILARILEDSTFSMLNSAIYFNEVEIVNEVVGERKLIKDVFEILNGANSQTSVDKGKGKERELGPKRTTIGPELPESVERFGKKPRLDLDGHDDTAAETRNDSSTSGSDIGRLRQQQAIQFLTQLTQMAKNLQLPLRTSLYRTLVERGLLVALENALRFANELEDVGLRAQVIAIWMSVVDLDAKDVRAHCLKQGKDKETSEEDTDDTVGAGPESENGSGTANEGSKKTGFERTMLGGLIETFKVEEDLGIKTQLAEALRVLVDAAGDSGPLEAPPRLRPAEDPEAEKFLQHFYDHYILALLQPLIELPERPTSAPQLDLQSAQTALLSHLCDLLCFFIAHHSFRSKYLILSSPQLAKSVSHLLRPRPRLTRHTHLRLAALRFLRACVARNDDFYNRFLIKHDLVRCVVETAEDEKDRDNLLGSACLEFFEYVRSTNAKGLINHLMDRCGDSIRRLAPSFKTFEGLVSRWEINNEPPPPATTLTSAQQDSSSGTEGGGNGSKGAMSEAMQRQTSKPGWPASGRMDLEEESYFNTDDDDDDDGDASRKEDTKKGDEDVKDTKGKPLDRATPDTSFHFASSRRKRETTSNPALSSSLNDSKRAKLDDEVSSEEDDKELKDQDTNGGSSLPRSQTWPQGATGAGTKTSGGGLVDYMDEDEDEDKDRKAESRQDQAKGDTLPEGGFVREQEHTTTAKEDPPLAAMPLPLPGAFKRKQEEEEEEEGLGGLLRSKSVKKTSSPLANTTKAKSPSSTTTTDSATAATPLKAGGFKIAFGTSLTKPTPVKPDEGKKGVWKFGFDTRSTTKDSSATTTSPTKASSPTADKG